MPSACDVEGELADRLHRVDVKRDPRSRAMRPIASIGWRVPTSLLACMMLIATVSGRIARRHVVGIDHAELVDAHAWSGRSLAPRGRCAGAEHRVVLDLRGDEVSLAAGPAPAP